MNHVRHDNEVKIADEAADHMTDATVQRWRLAELMAARGMHHSTDLLPLLRQRGIVMSRAQGYRIVCKQPERISLLLLTALCDILACRPDDLLAIPSNPASLRWSGPALHSMTKPSTAGGDARTGGGAARQRLLDAMAGCIAELGYHRTTVAHVVARAKASRRTFYRLFRDREDCYIALLTRRHEDLVAIIAAAVDPAADWKVQIRQAVEAWITQSEAQPALMLSWIRDRPTLGLAARQLQRNSMESFVAMLQALSDTAELRTAGIAPIPRHRAIMVIAGLRELTALTVESGGSLADITEDVIDACIAFGPR